MTVSPRAWQRTHLLKVQGDPLVTDSSEPSTIPDVVEQLALSSAQCDVIDPGQLAKMHTDMATLVRLVEAQYDSPDVAEFQRFGGALASLLEGIVLESYGDLAEALEAVRRAIADVRATLGADPDAVPLPSDQALVQTIIQMASSAPTAAEPTLERSQEPDSRKAEPSSAPRPDTQRAYVPEPLVIDTEALSDVESFVAEAQEHTDAIEAGLLDLAQAPNSRAKLDEVFRAFHTIKGMAAFLNLRDVNHLAHHAETMLDEVRQGALSLTPDHIDLIFSAVDLLKKQVRSIAEHLENPTGQPVPQPRIAEMLDQLRRATSPQEEATGTLSDSPPLPGTLAPVEAHARDSTTSEPSGAGAQKSFTTRVDTAKLDSLLEVVGELVIAQASLSQEPALDQHARLSSDISRLAKLVREVQEITMSLRMVSLRQTFRKMGRLARDLARKSGKQVDYTCSGEDTELDKSVIDAISDPLMHMVRNAIDHGIELPEERVAAGKPQQGRVHLHAAHQGGSILIEVADDGRGLDRDELIEQGIRRGLVSSSETLSEEQTLALIMRPAFSTAHAITDVSGRGVGMDVVKRNIESLRGKVEIHSEKGKGCKIKLCLPLTLAIIDGMVARVDESRFVIPMPVIDHLLRPRKEQVFAIHKHGEMLQVRGQLYPLMRLDALLNVRPERPPAWESMVAVVRVDGGRVGIVVDDLVGQQQVVIKTLGDSLKHVEGISGATILGDGTVGLILDASGLVSIHDRTHAASPGIDCSPTERRRLNHE